MLRIVIEVDAPGKTVQGVKEALAMDCEKYGDVRVVEVTEIVPQQRRLLYENGEWQVYG